MGSKEEGRGGERKVGKRKRKEGEGNSRIS